MLLRYGKLGKKKKKKSGENRNKVRKMYPNNYEKF